ncbi:hypothetical protein F511_21093 [Dorcoceras hygrometricum]|uniref:Uncharacterized protein n=1 Tax=Dorcoceras hygrometricum TaxID=472368 RepID=A0A2Z7A5R9_9LAMI|nr:hypothetical protein F511_21093 [Dorcoceras hygrometricum]
MRGRPSWVQHRMYYRRIQIDGNIKLVHQLGVRAENKSSSSADQNRVSATMTSAFLLLRRAGISNDDVTISRWIRRSAKEKLLTDEKNKGEVEVSFSSKLQYIQSQATVQPVENYSSLYIQSRATVDCLTSRWNLMLQLYGICDDDINSDVITISRWIKRSAKEKLLTDEKNKGEVEVAFSSKLQYIQSQATVQPVENYSSLYIQSRATVDCLTSRWNLMLAVVK